MMLLIREIRRRKGRSVSWQGDSTRLGGSVWKLTDLSFLHRHLRLFVAATAVPSPFPCLRLAETWASLYFSLFQFWVFCFSVLIVKLTNYQQRMMILSKNNSAMIWNLSWEIRRCCTNCGWLEIWKNLYLILPNLEEFVSDYLVFQILTQHI